MSKDREIKSVGIKTRIIEIPSIRSLKEDIEKLSKEIKNTLDQESRKKMEKDLEKLEKDLETAKEELEKYKSRFSQNKNGVCVSCTQSSKPIEARGISR